MLRSRGRIEGLIGWKNARSSLERSQQGGCSKIRSRDVPKPFSTISLILLWLSPTNRPRLCRSRKIGEDDSDPPPKRRALAAPGAARCSTPILAPQRVAIVLIYPCGKARNSPQAGRWKKGDGPMKWRRFLPHTFLFFAGLGYAVWSFVRRPFPLLGDSPLLDLMDYPPPQLLRMGDVLVLPVPRRPDPHGRLDPPGDLAGLVRGAAPEPVPARRTAPVAA